MDLVPEGLEPVDDPRDVLPPFRLHLDDDPRWTAAMSARPDQPLGPRN